MRKLSLSFFLITFTSFTFAQSINFGVKAGLNFSEMSFAPPKYMQNNGAVTGFHAGLIADIGIGNFSIQPGVLYITKGGLVKAEYFYSDVPTTVNYKYKLNYLEMPVNLLYHIHLVPGTSIYLGGGPYLGYGLSGTSTGPEQITNITFGQTIGGFGYRNPDYGVNLVAGIKIKNILIDLNYGLGLRNLSYDPGEKNRVVGFSIGYLLK